MFVGIVMKIAEDVFKVMSSCHLWHRNSKASEKNIPPHLNWK